MACHWTTKGTGLTGVELECWNEQSGCVWL